MIFSTNFRIVTGKILIAAFLLLSFLCSKSTITAQTAADAGLWTTATFEYGINSRLVLFVTEEFRLKENCTRLNLFYTNVGLEYKICKNLKTSLAYRSTEKYMPDNFFSFRHRIQWDVAVKKNFGKFDLSYRHRLQVEVKNMYSSDRGHLPEGFSRNKFQLKYDLDKPYAPYVSIELRYQIIDSRNPESDYSWHRVRYQAGMDYKINSHHYMGLYYLVQNEFNIRNPESLYIIGLEYTFKL